MNDSSSRVFQTKRTGTAKRAATFVLALLVGLTGALIFSPRSFAAAPLPAANDEPRHTVCRALSAQAQAYYTGKYSRDALSALSGAADASDSAAAMRDNALFDALHDLMTQTHAFYTTYSGYKEGSLAYYWASTDSSAGSDTYVMFYSDFSPADEGVKLNREHIWPKSRASYATSFGGADLHHLRPSAESVNKIKSDHQFGYVNGTYASGAETGIYGGNPLYWAMPLDDIFECKDDVKGDVARILLYVYCRWEQPNLYSDVAPEALPAMDEDDYTNTGVRVIESLDTLLQWCALDPVDAWEMERNDRIQDIQGNRNVFIDYPELAWRMFGMTAPNGMTTPTKEGCAHLWRETDRQAAGCVEDGAFTLTCSVCGEEYTRRLASVGHSDADDNEYCDVCGEPVVILTDLTAVTALSDGMHFVIEHPVSGSTMGKRTDDAQKLTVSQAHPLGDVLHPRDDTAIFTARQTEGGWYFICGGKYLTSAKTGVRFYWDDAPNEYSIWNVEAAGAGEPVRIVNLNAAYYGRQQAIEYYGGVFTVYSVADNDAFRLRIWAAADHVWDGGKQLLAPGCETAGSAEQTCVLCGGIRTVGLPAAGHALKKVEAVPPTVDSEGNIGYWTCETCGKAFFDADATRPVTDPAALSLPATEPEPTPADAPEGGDQSESRASLLDAILEFIRQAILFLSGVYRALGLR